MFQSEKKYLIIKKNVKFCLKICGKVGLISEITAIYFIISVINTKVCFFNILQVNLPHNF